MTKTNTDIVVIDRFDYDDLVERANATDEEIKKQAEIINKNNNRIHLKVEFDKYKNPKGFDHCIDVCYSLCQNDVKESLNNAKDAIYDWARENMKQYGKELREMNITKRNAIGLSKQVTNLEEKIKRYRIKVLLFWAYSLIATIIAFYYSFK